MQTLVIYNREDRKLIATFKLNTIVTEMGALVVPGVAYLMTLNDDIFYKGTDGQFYVKED